MPRLTSLFMLAVAATAMAAEPQAPAKKESAEKPAAASAAKTQAAEAESIEALVRRTMPSVVVIRGAGRDGKESGLGSGFVIDRSGLIATNMHVIGEGRSIVVQLADGRRLEPTAIHASDRNFDLAVIRVPADQLPPPLPLGDSDEVVAGQEVVALGNPQGLEHSVVKGIASGSREIDGMPLIQLAIPIEPGNSGGPLLDREGRVVGLVTMKSAVTDNLGFAVKVNAIKPLLEQPNTVTMDRWLTIGALDAKRWQTVGEARWRQRAGRILVSGAGSAFGGRSLCLRIDDAPQPTFELAVSVRLDDESGAAGLCFASDGADRHYGFYPSNGKLRFVRFDGPDVYSWQVLDERECDAYLPGEWNRLKVRVENDRAKCYVNGELVFDHDAGEQAGKRVGLAKFRQTEAEYKEFAVGRDVPEPAASQALLDAVAKVREQLPKIGSPEPSLAEPLAADADAAARLLEDRASALVREAEQLRSLAESLHRRHVVDELSEVLKEPEEKTDLLHAALLVAKLDNREVDVAAYREEVERMAGEIRDRLKKGAGNSEKIEALNEYLFDDNGYHGSRRDYYSRSNSYLNEVIDDREGLPITLAVLYIELGKRIGLNLEGIGLPGHFIAAHIADDGERLYLDPFEGGERLTEADAVRRSLEITGRTPAASQLEPVSKQAIVLRMLENLLNLAADDAQRGRMSGYLDAILAIAPDHLERRMMRCMVRYQQGRLDEALADVDYVLDHHREQVDEERVLELRDRLERERRE